MRKLIMVGACASLIFGIYSCKKDTFAPDNQNSGQKVEKEDVVKTKRATGFTQTKFERSNGPNPSDIEKYCTAPASDCDPSAASSGSSQAIAFDDAVTSFTVTTTPSMASIIGGLFPVLTTTEIDEIIIGNVTFIKTDKSKSISGNVTFYEAYLTSNLPALPCTYIDVIGIDHEYVLTITD